MSPTIDRREVMNRFSFQAMWFILSLSIAFPANAAEQGFVSLFDGKTLNGWTVNCLPKDKELAAKAWTIDDSTILAELHGPHQAFLYSVGNR